MIGLMTEGVIKYSNIRLKSEKQQESKMVYFLVPLMLTCRDFERQVTLRIEMAPTVFTIVDHIQKSKVYSPRIELQHFNSNITSASPVKERTPLSRSQKENQQYSTFLQSVS